VLLDFCNRQAISQFVLIDSDVMLYEDVGPFFKRYHNNQMTVSCPDERFKWAAAFFSIINDLSIIGTLCCIFEGLFSPSGKTLRDNLGVHPFYEMVGLYLLMKQHPDLVKNTYEEDLDELTVIHSFVEEQKFSRHGGFLKTQWIQGKPYVKRVDSGRLVKASVIHFHGKGKYVMGKYSRPKGWRISAENIANRFMGHIFKYPRRMMNSVVNPELFPKI